MEQVPSHHRQAAQSGSTRKTNRKSRKLQEELGYYDNILASTNVMSREDLELLAPGVNRVTQEDGSTFIIRHLDSFYPLSINVGGVEYHTTQPGTEQVLGSMMAQYHFNNRISTIVPQLADLDCDIKFTMDFYDTHFEPIVATRLLYEKLVASSNETMSEVNKYPTGLLGSLVSTISGPLAILGGVYNLTQVSFGSSANSLDNKDLYPYFGRIVQPVGGTARTLAEYYKKELQTNAVYVIYTSDSFGVDYFSSFQSSSTMLGFTIHSTPIDAACDASCEDFDQALRNLENSGYRYVLAVLTIPHYDILMPMAKNYTILDTKTKEAVPYPLVGDDRFWTFAYQLGSSFDVDEEKALATNGTATIRTAEGERLDSYDAYNEAWQELLLTDEATAYMESKLPPHVLETANYPGYNIPSASELSVFSYDSFMTQALASCAAADKYGTLFSGENLHEAFLDLDFVGATGNVRFDPTTGSRLRSTSPTTITNYLADTNPDPETGKYTIRSVDTHIYKKGEWEVLADQPAFIYADGTTTAPSDLPPVDVFQSEIEPWASASGYFASGLVFVVTLGLCAWVQRNHKADPIRASQPFFIYMLASGIILMGSSLTPLAALPVSSMPHIACMIGPWFLSTGYCVTFAAIFSKLMRINGIDKSSKKMVRVAIKPHQVLKPFAIMLSLNLVILITWTVISPLDYVSAEADHDRFGRPTTLVYSCQSDHAQWFRLVLGALDVVALALVAYNGYCASKIKMSYNESNHIFLGLLISSQSFLIGVPGVLAAGGDPSAEFFSRTFAVLWGCLGIILPILAPKFGQMKKWRKDKAKKEARRKERLARTAQWFNQATDTPATSSQARSSAASVALQSQSNEMNETNETPSTYHDSYSGTLGRFNDSVGTEGGMNGSMTESGRFFA